MHTQSTLDKNELIDTLREAQDHLRSAIDLMRTVVEETDDEWARRFILAPIEIATSGDHTWLAIGPTLDEWLKQLEEDAG